MSGLTSTVLLFKQLPIKSAGEVTAFLQTVATDVKDSRKGRYWEFFVEVKHSKSHAYSLSLISTKKHDYDYEDILLDRELDYESAPEAFEINSCLSSTEDFDFCKSLSEKLAELFVGESLGVA